MEKQVKQKRTRPNLRRIFLNHQSQAKHEKPSQQQDLYQNLQGWLHDFLNFSFHLVLSKAISSVNYLIQFNHLHPCSLGLPLTLWLHNHYSRFKNLRKLSVLTESRWFILSEISTLYQQYWVYQQKVYKLLPILQKSIPYRMPQTFILYSRYVAF